MSLELIDSHCHLSFDFGSKSAAQLISEASVVGVKQIICVGTMPSDWQTVSKIAETNAGVFHTIGVHPHEVKSMVDSDLSLIEKACGHSKCSAVGEIGLDYHYDHSPREVQLLRFEQQLELAARIGFPVVVHCREAEADVLRLLTRYVSLAGVHADRPGVLHCFSGSESFGKSCLDLGFFVSFSGILTFKNSKDLRAAARAFPLNRLMVETDAPYLAPLPYRGKKCEPAMVVETAKALAQTRGVGLLEIAEATTANARVLFAIPIGSEENEV